VTDREKGSESSQHKMLEEVTRKADRKLKARGQEHRSIWFGLGMFGLVGWAVAVPTLLGIALGVWLDANWPTERLSWTLTLLGVGIALGCLNAWYWVQRESRHE
jgi:ATP synthase protein I